MKKTFKDFRLSVEDGSLNEGEIIGIVGENGIGKTTFVKLLAGAEKEDNETNVFNMRMSYKPQDFDAEHVRVKEFFKGVNQEILMSELWFKLKINEIEELFLDELNTGTLQKIMIAKALSTDAEIYLLDEPSAFLDVEERINVAKIIQSIIAKRKKVAFVVDHDILFVDFISDKIIVFDGKPGEEGFCTKPKDKKGGMNQFLKILDVTYRKDLKSGRPRVNKLNSAKDKEQKAEGNYYIY
jgi:ATP-binding cassette subfamily E protein 1